MIKVLLADDHVIVRNVLSLLLERAGNMQVVAMASNGEEAVTQAVLHSPHVAVLDVSMPIMDGIQAAKHICAHCPRTHVLMISMHQTSEHIGRCIQAGALGYVLKEAAGDDLIMAIHSLHQGNRYFSKQIAKIADHFISQHGM